MSSKLTLSVLGLYTYDNSLFDNMSVPEGVDKPILIDNILTECAELEVLYPDFDFLKNYLGRWSASRINSWTKINDYYNIVLNPINEYDYQKRRTVNLNTSKTGTETDVKTGNKELSKTGSKELSKTGSKELSKTGTETNSTIKSGNESNTRTGSISDIGSDNRTANLTNTSQVSAYNSSDWENREKNSETGTDNHALSNSQTFNNLTDTLSFTNRNDTNNTTFNDRKDTETYTNRKDTETYSNRKDTETYNNITDTTTHNTTVSETGTDTITETGHRTNPITLIESAIVLASSNIYEYIVSEFKEKFCLMIY